MKKIFTIGLLSILICSACSNQKDETKEVAEGEKPEEEEVVEVTEGEVGETTNSDKITPEELTESMSNQFTEAKYSATTKTYTLKLSNEVETELINENNQFHTDKEYELMLEGVVDDYIYTSEIIYDYFGSGYTIEIVLDGNENKNLLLITDKELIENNLDLRSGKNSTFASEVDEEQYNLLSGYINTDYKQYVNNLEELTDKNYNNKISIDEYNKELDKAYSELESACSELLINNDTNETLSEEIGELVTNAYLSCLSLRTMHFNLMMRTLNDDELDTNSLKESLEYFKLAKEQYENM